jgi:protein gp37
VPAVVHFLSSEPLLGPLDLRPWLGDLQWVITGGESGPRHRPCDVAWVRDINAQCAAAGVAHFYKQHGGRTHAAGGCELDGIEVKQFPLAA